LVHKETKIQLLISSLISFAHQAGYQVTAEGVENKEQFDILFRCGCDKIQGYYIKEPVNEPELINFIKTVKIV
jgi:EAL domain-containing protein (putative c-di-GMP-specific phosphodiesterase class I)